MRANFIQNNQPLDQLNKFIALAEGSEKAIQTQEEVFKNTFICLSVL